MFVRCPRARRRYTHTHSSQTPCYAAEALAHKHRHTEATHHHHSTTRPFCLRIVLSASVLRATTAAAQRARARLALISIMSRTFRTGDKLSGTKTARKSAYAPSVRASGAGVNRASLAGGWLWQHGTLWDSEADEENMILCVHDEFNTSYKR